MPSSATMTAAAELQGTRTDWQYLGVGKFTLGLEWNCGRKARKRHMCEDTFAYGSYSSKDSE